MSEIPTVSDSTGSLASASCPTFVGNRVLLASEWLSADSSVVVPDVQMATENNRNVLLPPETL
eukprot:7298791-Pyramimonas_sp.AAC.1